VSVHCMGGIVHRGNLVRNFSPVDDSP
jgi:hypothetical protein